MPQLWTEAPSGIDFWRGLKVQAHCIYALTIRDMMMRYGRGNIGFMWIVLEPMILTAGVMGMWSLIKPPFEHGVQIVSFVLTGYMPLTLWRHMTNSAVYLFRRNAGLLYHRNISLLDAFIARMFLEFIGTTTALAVVLTVILAAGIVDPPCDLGLLTAAWLLNGLFSASVGLNMAVLTEHSEVAEKFIQPLQYLMLPLSGTFYMVDWLPTAAQKLAWYNPQVHIFEMFRAGFFSEEITTHYSGWYPFVWSLCLITAGLWGLDKVRNSIHFG
jgi:capsular polysaccharide transport system permease protein